MLIYFDLRQHLEQTIKRIYGNLTGLKPAQIHSMEQLYRRRLSPDSALTHDLARNLTEISFEIRRQVGILLGRRGATEYVIVGDQKGIVIPDLERLRASGLRLKGLRLVHTHLKQESLTRDDLNDLALLRLDMVIAVEVDQNGLPGKIHSAYLIPENPEGKFWEILPPSPSSQQIVPDFSVFVRALEDEFVKAQRTRKVESQNRAILVRVEISAEDDGAIQELKELADTAGVKVFDVFRQRRNQIDSSYVLGKGKLSELVIRALQIGANLLIFDQELTAAQVRSIADATDLKVIDRTQLILDIFAQRAHSREGKLQVELAQLRYLLPRLMTKNTAMSRLTGGIGGRGPGETKLEINRRRVRDRIRRLEQDLEKVQKEREQRRVKRARAGLPIISIIGYTNAGKSTLLNALTQSGVFTENRLFATLDPKSSRLRFPREREAVITDTVGFIRDLPKELLAAFRSTLEELNEADLLLHVVDISSPEFESHIRAVEKILEELELQNKPTLRVFNKEDRVPDKVMLSSLSSRFEAIPISALKPDSLYPLLEKMESLIAEP
jgi:GTPase